MQKFGGSGFWQSPSVFILLLWVFATSLNFTMPVHMDDTAHLLIAEHILRDPLHPMSGMLNWLDTAEPIFVTNQPHFYFYLIAGVMAVFGPSELILHLFQSVFTLAAIVGVYRLATRFVPEHSRFLTTALVVSPGFLINQNLMVDIPLLAMLTWSVLFLINPGPGRGGATAGFGIFSVALLTKYTALFLFPALIWAALKNRFHLALALLPIAALLFWGLFNLFDVGQVHILNRPANGRGMVPSPNLAAGLVGAMGAFAAPLAGLLVLGHRRGWLWGLLWVLATLGFAMIARTADAAVSGWYLVANGVLFAAALLVALSAGWRILLLAGSAWNERKALRDCYAENFAEATLALWLIGGTGFLITFPQFTASRHALLLAVPLFILALRTKEVTPVRFAVPSIVAIWAAFALFIFANDLSFASFYKRSANQSAVLASDQALGQARMFTRGHWGWQWYSRGIGLTQVDSERTQFRAGDILVDPVGISAQQIDDMDKFEVLESIKEHRSLLTILDTHKIYASGATALPLLAPNPGREILILRRTQD